MGIGTSDRGERMPEIGRNMYRGAKHLAGLKPRQITRKQGSDGKMSPNRSTSRCTDANQNNPW